MFYSIVNQCNLSQMTANDLLRKTNLWVELWVANWEKAETSCCIDHHPSFCGAWGKYHNFHIERARRTQPSMFTIFTEHSRKPTSTGLLYKVVDSEHQGADPQSKLALSTYRAVSTYCNCPGQTLFLLKNAAAYLEISSVRFYWTDIRLHGTFCGLQPNRLGWTIAYGIIITLNQ